MDAIIDKHTVNQAKSFKKSYSLDNQISLASDDELEQESFSDISRIKKRHWKLLRNKIYGLRKLPNLPPSTLQSMSQRFSISSPDVRLQDGRVSVDSAGFDSAYEGDDRCSSTASGRRTPGMGRLSPASNRRWNVVVSSIRERRLEAANENRNKLAELVRVVLFNSSKHLFVTPYIN